MVILFPKKICSTKFSILCDLYPEISYLSSICCAPRQVLSVQSGYYCLDLCMEEGEALMVSKLNSTTRSTSSPYQGHSPRKRRNFTLSQFEDEVIRQRTFKY